MTRRVNASMPKDLSSFLESIADLPGELATVSRTVRPNHYEVTALLEHLDRRHQYPTVLFEQPENLRGEKAGIRLVSGVFGTRERIARAIGHPPEQSLLPLSLEMARRERMSLKSTVITDDIPVQETVWRGREADLARLPLVRHYAKDLAPVITMAMVLKDPDEDFYDVSFVKTFYRDNPDWAGISIHSPHLERILAKWEERGQNAPCVLILGHHPAFFLGVLANTPYGTNDYDAVGAYLQEPLRTAPSVTWGDRFLVPADAEIIVEGHIPAGKRTVVDPFGEVTRLYQPQCLQQVLEVEAITMRSDPIMQDIFSGHQGHWNLSAIPKEGSIYNALNVRFGNVTGVHMPHSLCSRLGVYISIRKTAEGQAKPVGMAALVESAQLNWAVIVDDDIDVYNEPDVIWAIATYTNPSRDIDLIKNYFQFFNTASGYQKGVIDATRPLDIAFPEKISVPQEAMDRINVEEWIDSGKNFLGRVPGLRGTLVR